MSAPEESGNKEESRLAVTHELNWGPVRRETRSDPVLWGSLEPKTYLSWRSMRSKVKGCESVRKAVRSFPWHAIQVPMINRRRFTRTGLNDAETAVPFEKRTLGPNQGSHEKIRES